MLDLAHDTLLALFEVGCPERTQRRISDEVGKPHVRVSLRHSILLWNGSDTPRFEFEGWTDILDDLVLHFTQLDVRL